MLFRSRDGWMDGWKALFMKRLICVCTIKSQSSDSCQSIAFKVEHYPETSLIDVRITTIPIRRIRAVIDGNHKRSCYHDANRIITGLGASCNNNNPRRCH